MRWVGGIILAGLLASAGRGQATQPAAGDDLARWIAELGSDQWEVREEAAAQLVRYGPDCAPALSDLLITNPDLEVQARARDVLRRIANWPVYPTFVTVHLHAAPAREAFAEIAAAAHLQLPTERPELWTEQTFGGVTIDAVRQPFWSVVCEACRQTGLTVNLDVADMRTIELVPGKMGHPDVGTAIMGAMPQCLPSFGDMTAANIKFPLVSEPGVRVLEYPLRDESGNSLWAFEEVVDGGGHTLHFDPPAARDASVSGHWVMATLHLGASTRGLTRLRVRAPLVIQTSEARMDVDDFAHLTSMTRTDSGVTMRVTRVATGKPDAWEIQEQVQRDSGNRDQADLIDKFFSGSARLFDDEGRPFYVTFSQGVPGEGLCRHVVFGRHGVGQRYPRGEPKRLVIELPLSSKEISVPLTWKDIRLDQFTSN